MLFQTVCIRRTFGTLRKAGFKGIDQLEQQTVGNHESPPRVTVYDEP
jgi:hypothetical protein